MAIPLSRVARLEELPRNRIERVGHELLVQYRGEIMAVVELSDMVIERRAGPRAAPRSETDVVQVVVFRHGSGHVGLIVEQIVDIVDDRLADPWPAGRPGVLGSVVISGRVTELFDVEEMLRRAQPGVAWTEATAAPTTNEEVGHGA
jgi:two-component system chemotaxis sensor kinase CheA